MAWLAQITHDYLPVVVGDRAWIAEGAVILGGVTIGEGAVVLGSWSPRTSIRTPSWAASRRS
jgi:carbonic anhydrase/acetyltransferase-like protein (isoleucine patch superfamily)